MKHRHHPWQRECRSAFWRYLRIFGWFAVVMMFVPWALLVKIIGKWYVTQHVLHLAGFSGLAQ